MTQAQLEQIPGGLRLTGPLTRETVPALWSGAPARLCSGEAPCRVDLSGVTRSDSAGVALLLAWLRLGGGQGLVYTGVPAHMRPLIRLSDLEGVLPEAGTQEG
ncbi:STAS domain-containing protein [Ectothiorhodospira mobilis]|uniref:STAS domain-containing protein n=1 Tax=Ectothiorhodospira mobilis TaxID=195064 RepID=UPI00190302C7|nr:STAS domain-containing protein [Ectothiorhodospira mobilis]MBK1692690.1 hypothetical protein [Ectothiorhodospira mobilis]